LFIAKIVTEIYCKRGKGNFISADKRGYTRILKSLANISGKKRVRFETDETRSDWV